MASSTLNSTNDSAVITDGPIFDGIEDELFGVYIYPFVFVIFYMVIGTIGNAVVIYIFTMQWKLTKTTVFILTLAVVDICSCLINMPVEAAILWHPMNFDIDVLCKITRFTTFIASASSSFVLVAISVDRYLMICRPFLGRELGVRYAKKTCVIAVLLGVISTWPSLIFYGTFTFYIPTKDPDTSDIVNVEGKTCLISNFYVENDKLPAGFYFFLFGGHVIMFVILTMMYILIGRSLFLSTDPDVSQEKRHSLKYFGISMMSALTGSIPNTPIDATNRYSLGGRSPRARSMENVNRISLEHVPRIDRSLSYGNVTGRNPHTRISAETTVSIVINDDNAPSDNEGSNPNITRNGNIVHANGETNAVNDKLKEEDKSPKNKKNGSVGRNHSFDSTLRKYFPKRGSSPNNSNANNRRNHLNLNLNTNTLFTGHFQRTNERLSSESVGSDKSLTPMSPDSVKGILLRSQSVESRARLNRIISDELKHTVVKEFSMRRNTLIMRMVTIAFIVSFLPYLVIVTLRYSNPDIPTKLSKPEQIAYHVFLRTYFINSMINPFIYGFMNMEFRTKLMNLFCKPCSRPNVPLY